MVSNATKNHLVNKICLTVLAVHGGKGYGPRIELFLNMIYIQFSQKKKKDLISNGVFHVSALWKVAWDINYDYRNFSFSSLFLKCFHVLVMFSPWTEKVILAYAYLFKNQCLQELFHLVLIFWSCFIIFDTPFRNIWYDSIMLCMYFTSTDLYKILYILK
jgi:hypothetical protein